MFTLHTGIKYLGVSNMRILYQSYLFLRNNQSLDDHLVFSEWLGTQNQPFKTKQNKKVKQIQKENNNHLA